VEKRAAVVEGGGGGAAGDGAPSRGACGSGRAGGAPKSAGPISADAAMGAGRPPTRMCPQHRPLAEYRSTVTTIDEEWACCAPSRTHRQGGCQTIDLFF